MSTTTARPVTQVTTGTVRLSYEHIWKPSAAPGSTEEKYSASLIISKDDKKTLAAINAAVKAATEAGKAKWGGKIPPKLKLPLRDGDEERPDKDEYVNAFFVNANANRQPGIVDRNCNRIMNQEEVYSGCYVVGSITFYPYDSNGSKGVACGLNHIMKVRDGEHLDGQMSAEQAFAGIELDEVDDLM